MAVTLEAELFSTPEHDRTIMAYWERFMAGESAKPPLVRSLIERSWQRCQEGDVDHRRDQAPPPVDGERLGVLQELCRDLITASSPVMALARDFLRETGTVMVLTDAQGNVLSLEGDKCLALQDATEKIHLLPGADWSELTCGTNAIGTALATGLPIQVHATEHFCFGIKPWSCSASVIRDPFDRSILGVVDVSGLRGSYSRHSMALVVAAASRIETHFAQIETEYRVRLLKRCFWKVPQRSADHVVVFDRHGRPIDANVELETILRTLGMGHTDGSRSFRLADAEAGLPEDWLTPVVEGAERLGTILVVPGAPARRGLRPAARPNRPAAFADVIGDDPAMRQAVARAERVASTQAPVLLLGETGVGKELFARNLHRASAAAEGPFVALNCGALTRELLQSELFGYAEGAFTGARKGGMIGKIEAAHEGTLFLDEIGEMPLELQPMFLRVLEERELCRLGEVRPRPVRFRLIAATNRDLKEELAAKRFRADLFYRIAVVAITLPPLRARKDEIPKLVAHFGREVKTRYGLPERRLSPEAMARLVAYDWPGNVRELRNVVESLFLTAADDIVTEADLPVELAASPVALLGTGVSGLTAIEAAEREAILSALQRAEGKVQTAARQLGLAKSTLYAKLKRYGLGHPSAV